MSYKYKWIYLPTYINANSNGMIREHRYIAEQKLKAIYMGKGFMIREDDLDEFIKSRYLFQYNKGEN